jgi:hypothetical protein
LLLEAMQEDIRANSKRKREEEWLAMSREASTHLQNHGALLDVTKKAGGGFRREGACNEGVERKYEEIDERRLPPSERAHAQAPWGAVGPTWLSYYLGLPPYMPVWPHLGGTHLLYIYPSRQGL